MTSPSEPGPAAAGQRDVRALAVLASTVFLVFYNTTVATSLEKPVAASLSLGAGGIALFTDITALLAGPLILLAGHLGRRLRGRTALAGGIALLAVGSAGTALSGGLAEGVVFRALQGAGSAFIIVITLALGSRALGPGRRGLAIALWTTGVSSGLAVGPIAGYAAAAAGGDSWRWAFGGLALAAAAALAACLLWAPRDEPGTRREPGRVDWAGAVLSVLALAGIVTGITEGSDWGWGDGKTVGCLAGGVVLLAGFGWLESRVSGGILDLSPFRRRSFSLASAVVVLQLTWTIGAYVYVGLVLGPGLHAGTLQTGFLYLPMTGVPIVLVPLVGRIVDRAGFRPLLIVSGLCAIAGLAECQLVMESGGAGYGAIVPGLVLLGVAASFAAPVQSAAVLEGVPAELAEQGSAINSAGVQIGSAIGAGLVLSVFTSRFGPHAAFAPAIRPAVIAMVAVACCCVLVASGISTAQIRSVRREAS